MCPSPIQRKFREDVVAVARCQEDGVTIKQMVTDASRPASITDSMRSVDLTLADDELATRTGLWRAA